MALSYSFHLSNKKNAVSAINKIAQVDRHNLRKYDEKKHGEIKRLAGGDSILDDVKKIYHEEFDECLQKYNEGRRGDRQIGDYLKHVSDSRADVAAEIIVQIGDKDFWNGVPRFARSQINPMFENQLRRLGELVPEFKVASAVVHYDEASPHMHIVGVPVATGYKIGMEKQVAKTKIFTSERLSMLQEEMRKGLEDEMRKYPAIFNEETLKEKEVGRNKDLPKALLDEYYSTRRDVEEQAKLFAELATKSKRLNDPNRTEPVEFDGKEYMPLPELVKRSNKTQNELEELNIQIDDAKANLTEIQRQVAWAEQEHMNIIQRAEAKAKAIIDAAVKTVLSFSEKAKMAKMEADLRRAQKQLERLERKYPNIYHEITTPDRNDKHIGLNK